MNCSERYRPYDDDALPRAHLSLVRVYSDRRVDEDGRVRIVEKWW